MYCACIWDEDSEQVIRFYWVSTFRRAARLAAWYRRITGKECFVETVRSNYNLDNACGY